MMLHCALLHSFVTDSLSFVKLLKKMIDELYLYEKILSRYQVNHF